MRVLQLGCVSKVENKRAWFFCRKMHHVPLDHFLHFDRRCRRSAATGHSVDVQIFEAVRCPLFALTCWYNLFHQHPRLTPTECMTRVFRNSSGYLYRVLALVLNIRPYLARNASSARFFACFVIGMNFSRSLSYASNIHYFMVHWSSGAEHPLPPMTFWCGMTKYRWETFRTVRQTVCHVGDSKGSV